MQLDEKIRDDVEELLALEGHAFCIIWACLLRDGASKPRPPKPRDLHVRLGFELVEEALGVDHGWHEILHVLNSFLCSSSSSFSRCTSCTQGSSLLTTTPMLAADVVILP